jgi:7-cyano-7-deazaguanine synthase
MKAVVLLSGGVDSTVALGLMLERNLYCEALTIDYGQVNNLEIEAAKKVADYYGVLHKVVPISPLLFTGSALLGFGDIPVGEPRRPDATYVPARNTVLLALAAARAEATQSDMVVIGANADDAVGYPDCRAEYLNAFRSVLRLGTVNQIWVSTPLLLKTKREVLELGREINAPLSLTYSCYRGAEVQCGECGACQR